MSDLQERFTRLSNDVEAEPMAVPATIRRRGDARTRHQLAAVVVGVAAAVVAGVVTVTVSGGGGDRLQPVITPTPTASPTPSASPSLSPSPASTPADMPATHPKQVLVGPVILDVPDGWQADNAGAGAPTFDHACIEPPTTRPEMFGCAGLDVWYRWSDSGYLPGNGHGSFTDAPGWLSSMDVQNCPVKPTDGPGNVNGVRQDSGVTHDLRSVGDRTADFYRWHAHCDNGYTFAPRAWYLPVSRVVIFDRIGYPDLDPIVTSARFDTGRWTIGLLESAHSSPTGMTVAFDELRWLDGKAALAYNEAHGGHRGPPNDYLTVDPDPSTVALPVASDALIVSEFGLAGTEPGHHVAVTLKRLLEYVNAVKTHGYTMAHVHIRSDGVADQIWQQYTP